MVSNKPQSQDTPTVTSMTSEGNIPFSNEEKEVVIEAVIRKLDDAAEVTGKGFRAHRIKRQTLNGQIEEGPMKMLSNQSSPEYLARDVSYMPTLSAFKRIEAPFISPSSSTTGMTSAGMTSASGSMLFSPSSSVSSFRNDNSVDTKTSGVDETQNSSSDSLVKLPSQAQPARISLKDESSSEFDEKSSITNELPQLELDLKHASPSLFYKMLNLCITYIDRHYILTNRNPDIILPLAPTDDEKYSYINTKRLLFVSLGLIAFLSASAGLWLFTLCSPYFYWYGPIAAMLQLHISISYYLGLVARDFNLEEHKKILLEYPLTSDDSPSIDILLPVCKEPLSVLRNTWNHVSKLKYPEGKLNVWVLDDGALDEVKEMTEEFRFNYIRREDRPYFRKAGNLRNAFKVTQGDFFVIFDADFCPRSDFLLEIIPRMKHDPNIAVCQTPQYFKTRKEHTWVERGASEVQELFYRWTQQNRDKYGASICVGSNAVYRREALKETGGTALVAASEDVHTGFYAITRGWKLKYIPICLASGMSPDNPKACFSQQIRWSQGSTSLLLNGHFHHAKLGFFRKMCFLSGMLYYWTSAITMFTLPMPGIFIVWLKPALIKYYNLAFALPSILYGILIFKLWTANSHSLATQQIHVLQNWAYLFGIKDRILGNTHEWVVSGAATMAAANSDPEKKVKRAKKKSIFHQARRAAVCWTVISQGAFWAGCAYLISDPSRGAYHTNGYDLDGVYTGTYAEIATFHWYDLIPQMILFTFQLYCTLPFLLSVSA